MENLGYLIGAYMIFWVLTTLYVATIDRRQKELTKTLEKWLRAKGSV